ncbi:MAG: amidohydrolase family protein [Clostridia bacterium]|nr:amidohydrolase family protein [Clostridia bacterium]
MNRKYDILLKGGTLADPVNNLHGVYDVGIKTGKIIAVAEGLNTGDAGDVFDVSGYYVMPGIVDLHTHLSKWLGGPCGHKMLAQAGVTTALDMSGPIDGVLDYARDYGAGLTVASIDRLTQGYSIDGDDPSYAQLEQALNRCLKKGSIGLKIMAGNYPLTPEATANAIQLCNDRKAYVAFHAATVNTGSHIEGFHEAIKLAGDNCMHLAHINSYCRGLIRPCMEETQEAIDALEAHPNIRSEAYLSPLNGNNGKCVNGVPEASVIRNCLKMGGYEPTEAGYEKAIMDGWAQINMVSGGETVLRSGKEAVEFWKAMGTDTGVSFAVNPPQPRYWLATAKRDDGEFVVDAISTDGGGIPRNVILSYGLSLVKMKALSMDEFVKKASVNPGRILGMNNKGHLGLGADADITVVDYERQKAYLSIGSGKLIMYRGYVCGKGTNILTTEDGVENVKNYGLNPVLTDISNSALYKGI